MSNFLTILKRHSLEPPVRYGIGAVELFPDLEMEHYVQLLFQTSAQLIQWRQKDWPDQLTLQALRVCLRESKKTDKVLLLNTKVEMALHEGCHGVHLTAAQSVSDAVKARRRFGRQGDFLVGKSVHTVDEAAEAESEGVDYVMIGPVFHPLSKSVVGPRLGLTGLREVVQMLFTPVIAVGGIEPSNTGQVLGTGVQGIAGISWVEDEIRSLLRSSSTTTAQS